jgi:hypothetical protein
MIRTTMFLVAGAVGLAAAVPAAAQTPYQYPYPQQTYPQQGYPQQGYPQPGYANPQQGQNVVNQMIGQLLGNRYQANDRYAVERCATAAMAQASAQYRPNQYGQGYGNPNQGYGYGNQGYHPANMRVTAVTEVRRRNNSVRVSGLLDSRGGYGQPYGNAYGYQGQGYAGQGDLTFRCNVDYRGAVSNVRVTRNRAAYNRGY